MTTRAQLQSKSIEELRQIAEAVGVEADGLQKSRLISALMEAGGVTEDEAPQPDLELPRATPRTERPEGGAPSDDEDGGDSSMKTWIRAGRAVYHSGIAACVLCLLATALMLGNQKLPGPLTPPNVLIGVAGLITWFMFGGRVG